MRSWVNIESSLLCQVAKILVVDEALFATVQIVEDQLLVFAAHLDFQSLHAANEFIKTHSVVKIDVEEPESGTKIFETLLDSDPNEV